MALRKPLVVVDGKPQQLQAGDTLDAVAIEVDSIVLGNAAATAQTIGTPVYISGSSAFQPARANASGTCEVAGLVRDASVANASTGSVLTDGILTASTAQWDAITGQTGGLTPGAVYFLSAAVAGKLTSTAPTSIGAYVVRVGRAFSTTDMDVTIQPSILL